MNKTNKRLLVSAILVFVLGFVTLIPSVLTTIPYLQQVIAKTEKQREQTPLETITEQVTTLKVDVPEIAIRIETSESDAVQLLVENSNVYTLDITTKRNQQELTVSGKGVFTFPKLSRDANQFIEEITDTLINEQAATLVIQIPKAQPVNLEVINATDVTIVDSERLGAETKISNSGVLQITNSVAPTSPKRLTYETRNNYYYSGNMRIDYQTLNAFTDVMIRADYISLENQFYTEALTADNVTIEAVSINYQYLPFTGTVTLRDYSGLTLDFTSLPNIEWQIQTESFNIFNPHGETLVHGSPWQFNGYFWPNAEKASGKLIIDSNYLGIFTQQTNPSILDFANTQADLEVTPPFEDYSE